MGEWGREEGTISDSAPGTKRSSYTTVNSDRETYTKEEQAI